MPSIRKRNGLWQAQVRKKNTGSISKSFHRKSDATKWALQQEITLQSGSLISKQRDDHTLNCLMNRYLEEVTPHKRGKEQEGRRIKRLLNDNQLMKTPLRAARPPVFATFRDTRIHDGVRACQYDLVLLRHAWNIALIEWGWDIGPNPLALIRFPKSNPPRERRLKSGEYECLKLATYGSRSWYLWPIIEIAIETAMRRGEILGLLWENIDFERQRALLPLTKNGRSRWIPLSPRAIDQLQLLPRQNKRVFPVTANAFRLAWDRLRGRAGIKGLTFHDLRHEAISRIFERGLSIPEVMRISGHRTATQLFRYIQINSI